MFAKLRALGHLALTAPVLRGLPIMGTLQELAGRANRTLGEPLCTEIEQQRRRDARARLAALRSGAQASAPTSQERALPPLFLYVDGDKSRDPARRIEELCASKGYTVARRDVSDDEAMREFVLRESGLGDRDELPVLFAATTALGTHATLVEREVAGRLDADLRGEPLPA